MKKLRPRLLINLAITSIVSIAFLGLFVSNRVRSANRLIDISINSEIAKQANLLHVALDNHASIGDVSVIHKRLDRLIDQSTFDIEVKERLIDFVDQMSQEIESESPRVDYLGQVDLEFETYLLDVNSEENREAIESGLRDSNLSLLALVVVVLIQITLLMWSHWDYNEIVTLQAENIVASKYRAIGQAAGGIAHEISNPLTVVLGACSLIEDEIQTSAASPLERARIGKLLEKMSRSASRIHQIIKGLREMAHSTNPSALEVVSIKQIIDESIEYCAEKINRAQMQVICLGDLEFDIQCRPTQISQVLVNLIGNSCDALEGTTSPWTKIEVVPVDGGKAVEISVTDSGPGIPAHIAEKLSQPFFTTKGVEKGTGLGLSISRAIAEEHQGKFFLDREAKNTRFILHLPFQRYQQSA